MSMQQTIQQKLSQQIPCTSLEVINESHHHAGHAHGADESHFRVAVVSEAFRGKGKVARHQMIYRILADELAGPLHALVIEANTPEERS
jgi:BolA protein